MLPGESLGADKRQQYLAADFGGYEYEYSYRDGEHHLEVSALLVPLHIF
jgi:hypothetical protein